MSRRRAMMTPKGGEFQVNWNQYAGGENMSGTTYAGVTIHFNAERTHWTITGTATQTRETALILEIKFPSDHKIVAFHSPSQLPFTVSAARTKVNEIVTAKANQDAWSLRQTVDETYDYTLQMWVYDLTQMFGQGNEPTDIAAFESWLAENNLDGYQPYTESELKTTTKPSWI